MDLCGCSASAAHRQLGRERERERKRGRERDVASVKAIILTFVHEIVVARVHCRDQEDLRLVTPVVL